MLHREREILLPFAQALPKRGIRIRGAPLSLPQRVTIYSLTKDWDPFWRDDNWLSNDILASLLQAWAPICWTSLILSTRFHLSVLHQTVWLTSYHFFHAIFSRYSVSSQVALRHPHATASSADAPGASVGQPMCLFIFYHTQVPRNPQKID